MRRICLILSFLAAGITASGQSSLRGYVEQVAGQEPFVSCVWGVKAAKLGGKQVIEYNSLQKMVPASNTKLVTTGLALFALGDDYRFQTSLACSGEIEQGVLHGDIYIVGHGDPTLEADVFPSWKAILDSVGIVSVEGDIIADSRYFENPADFEDWSYEDFESEDASGVTGLSFKHNYREKEDPSLDDGYNCASQFGSFLGSQGIAVSGGCFGSENYPGELIPADSLKILGDTYSAPLAEIIYKANHKSDNFYAEALFRTMGKKYGKSDSYEDCAAFEISILADLGVDVTTGVVLRDGSGLSRKNYISPDFFVRYLTRMASLKDFDVFLKSLPQPGKGTLSTNMAGYPDSIRNRVWMKSGSMNGTRCYSGYVMPESGGHDDIIAFSIMINNNTAPSGTVLKVIDRIIALIAE